MNSQLKNFTRFYELSYLSFVKKSLRVELYLSLTDTLGSELASTAVTDVIHQKGNPSKGTCLLPVDGYLRSIVYFTLMV